MKKNLKLIATVAMSSATSLKHQQPKFMAVKRNRRPSDESNVIKKKWRVDSAVLLTWLIVITLTVVFWFFILKLW